MINELDEKVYLGSRNIRDVYVIPAISASAYDLLDCQILLVDEKSVNILNEKLGN